jgi:hypothetical protein
MILVAISAVHRSFRIGYKRHFSFLTAVCASCFVHLTRTSWSETTAAATASAAAAAAAATASSTTESTATAATAAAASSIISHIYISFILFFYPSLSQGCNIEFTHDSSILLLTYLQLSCLAQKPQTLDMGYYMFSLVMSSIATS